MKRRSLIAVAVAGASLLGAVSAASPVSAHRGAPPSIVAALAASGGTPDRNGFDFDILLSAVSALPFDAADPAGPTLAQALTGFTGTVFAPTDAAFIALVADLTNTPARKVSERQALDILLQVAATPDLNGTGVSGAAALSETVKYHVTGAQIRDLGAAGRQRTVVTTLTALPVLGLSDGQFRIERPFFGLASLSDDDRNDADPLGLAGPFGLGTVRTADGGTIHAITGVLRPLDLAVLFPAD